MNTLLSGHAWQFTAGKFRHRLFDDPEPETDRWLKQLYSKYHGELVELSQQLQIKFQAMTGASFSATFGDVEGELLYLLVREFQPELVFEISPNAGFSTNYLLAAVTRNGRGRIEGFEVEPRFLGRPTDEVIRGNLIDLCDPSRYRVNIGDARITALDRLCDGIPDFVMLDSCHEDYFAEFYIKELLPRCRGIVFIQDIAHFDPRPEHSTEAAYVLSYFQETATRFLPIGVYEDALNLSGTRASLRPRRPIRSNSVVVRLPDVPYCLAPPDGTLPQLVRGGKVDADAALRYPLHAAVAQQTAGRRSSPLVLAVQVGTDLRPEDRYVAAQAGLIRQDFLGISDLLALRTGKAGLSDEQERLLVRDFGKYDPYCQVLILEVLTAARRNKTAGRLLKQYRPGRTRGAELPCRVARVAARLGERDIACRWLELSQQAVEPTLAVGHRNLLDCADLYLSLGERSRAQAAVTAARQLLAARSTGRAKISRELAVFCLKHPRYLPILFGKGFCHDQWLHAAVHLLRGAARRWYRRLRSLGRGKSRPVAGSV